MKPRNTFKPFYGINGGPGAFWPEAAGPTHGFASVTEQYREIGVQYIRVHDFFGAGDMMNYFPVTDADNLPDVDDPNSYYWVETDKQLANIREGGFQLHIGLGQGWRNMASWALFWDENRRVSA